MILLFVIMYVGMSSKELEQSGIRIVLTTYDVLARAKEDSVLLKYQWHRIVLDEAHVIRKSKSKKTVNALKLQSYYRWAVTGTPFSNRISDVATICRFVAQAPWVID